MAKYYVTKQTKRQYPNTVRMFNKHRKTNVSTVFSVDRLKRNGWPEPVGMFKSLRDAIAGAKKHGKKRGFPVNIERH